MADFTLKEKDGYTILGIGMETQSHYTDPAGINKEKADFWSTIKQDDGLDTLKTVAQ